MSLSPHPQAITARSGKACIRMQEEEEGEEEEEEEEEDGGGRRF